MGLLDFIKSKFENHKQAFLIGGVTILIGGALMLMTGGEDEPERIETKKENQ